MKTRRALTRMAIVALIAAVQAPVRSQGLLRNQLAGLEERTVSGVRVWTPPGFTIERVTPADRTDSYVALTFDAQGRLAVSKENDFPRLLLDRDGDGVFESETIVSQDVRNCQGLWFDGPALYGSCALADSAAPRAPGSQTVPAAGIVRMADTNGDDRADTFETLTLAGRMQEHGPHAIRRTPSGTWMVMMGNNETIADQELDFSSPVLHNVAGQFLPVLGSGGSRRQGAHSALFEWDAAQRRFRVFSGGNRNAYDFAYNLAGEAFLFDSDHEPDIGLPWYRQVRTTHQIPNGDYGYRDTTGKYPAYYLDSLPPLRDVGRGSPVGVETYQSYAYPREYFDNLLEADWSRGRILYTALNPKGATYSARPDPAELIHGEPLNVTDLEVGPDGLLYFSTGGRLTQGGVWRVRYTGAPTAQPDKSGILAVVRQEQPLSSWGWAAIERVKTTMGDQAFGAALERLARDTRAQGADRARALYELQRHGPLPDAELLSVLSGDRDTGVRAAVMFVAGYQPKARNVAAAGLKDADSMARRRAAEALVRLGQSPDAPSLAPAGDIYALLTDADRFVRWAGRILLEHTPRTEWQARVFSDDSPTSAPDAMVAWGRTAGRTASLERLIDRQLALMQQAQWPVDDIVRLYRAFMLTTTLMPGTAGVSAAARERLYAAVSLRFPSSSEPLNREAALLLAYTGQARAIGQILAAMPEDRSNQELTLQYLYALRAIGSGWTAAEKRQLAEVLGKTSQWRGGTAYATSIGQLFDAFAGLYTTDAERATLYAAAPDFAPFTAEEQSVIQARGAGPGGVGGARGAGGRRGATPIQARTQSRVLNKGEIFDEVIYTPRTEEPNLDAGRQIFEASCAACHRAGSIGNSHGVATLDLTTSARAANRRDLLESIMFPSRQVASELRDTIVTLSSGDTVRGLVVRETQQTLTILRSDGTTSDVAKPVRVRTRESSTVMLDAVTDRMTQPQLTNLLAFLQQ